MIPEETSCYLRDYRNSILAAAIAHAWGKASHGPRGSEFTTIAGVGK